MTFDTGNGLCANCIAGVNALSSNPFVENSGGKITFDFGKIISSVRFQALQNAEKERTEADNKKKFYKKRNEKR